ncbi:MULTISPECIES: YijD family membrane protein [Tatumella]|uniref:YijD family membrane protein n=1 Tax=Tatumella punctata TaxID=399969 RepID=A0ABW1VS95_9GAMM|nr:MULTISPECIES: YijD family membrane protein [unclassified Tatumella]MBS0877959.1 YijD family membrane protein [Tatumella sp. JGM82]MBS0891665.1 YijD family membrane protein [Tatumella sp. JGM94]MBS0893790.1 YijD family membrane protein [Tatumella sp. JGM130]MBS0902511.1 YijD family membrane protein [Tatumella sp. JGM100]
MTEQNTRDKGTLILAFIAGLSINGSFSALFTDGVPFSFFPLISLALSVWYLHQRYLNRSMPEGTPSLAGGFFLLGILVCSAVIRTRYPQIGSDFLPVLLMVCLVFWIFSRFRRR